jgi:hypothetical protein
MAEHCTTLLPEQPIQHDPNLSLNPRFYALLALAGSAQFGSGEFLNRWLSMEVAAAGQFPKSAARLRFSACYTFLKPESSIIVALIVLFLGLEPHAVAQKSGGLGAIPSALLPQIQQLASLLQRNVAEGKLSDAQIQSELEQGNLAALIHRLGPRP